MFGWGAASTVGLGVFNKVRDLWSREAKKNSEDVNAWRADSYVDYTQVSRVEPIVLVDTDCLYLESLSDIQQSLLSIFAGYYLQAVAISNSVGKINVMRSLDKLNPTRSTGHNVASTMGWLLAEESYKHCLPTVDKMVALEAMSNDELNQAKHDLEVEKWEFDSANKQDKANFDTKKFKSDTDQFKKTFEFNKEKFGHDKAMDILQNDLAKAGLVLRQQEREDKLSASEIGFGKDTMKDLKELANLSVGKMFSVELTDGFHKASIPVSIRLMASSLPSSNMVHILSIGSKDNTVKERYHAWKAGRLEFIKDLVLCQDLIDSHRKNLMADKDGIYTNLIKRARSNQLSTLVTANPSIATASNIVIISSTTAEQLELHLNGKLSNFKTRERMFKETFVMLFVVVDKAWERVTIYHRGLHLPTEVSTRDMKSANKNDGISVSDVMKAYQAGTGISI